VGKVDTSGFSAGTCSLCCEGQRHHTSQQHDELHLQRCRQVQSAVWYVNTNHTTNQCATHLVPYGLCLKNHSGLSCLRVQ